MDKKTSSSLVEKARAFARTLASSEEFKEYYALQQKLKNDPEAQALLEAFDRKHLEIQSGMMQGRGGKRDPTYDPYVEIQALQDRIRENDTLMDWVRAEQLAKATIQEANDAISGTAGFDFGRNASNNGAC